MDVAQDPRDEELGEVCNDSKTEVVRKEKLVAVKDNAEPPSLKQVLSEDAETIPDDLSNEFVLEGAQSSDIPFIELPAPGFAHSLEIQNPQETRLVPNGCAICLSDYEVGDNVVWSSNPACEHVFHEDCIEKWLMKLRADPVCPCCRRDFIVDPLDMDEDEAAEMALDHPTMFDFEEDAEL